MKTGLITSDTYKNHNTGNGHPEKIDRVTAIIDNFKKVDNKNLIWKNPNKFDEFFLNKTHSIEYIKLNFFKSVSETASSTLCIVFPTKPNSKQGAIFLMNLASDVPPVVESLGFILVTFLITFCIMNVVLLGFVRKASPETL